MVTQPRPAPFLLRPPAHRERRRAAAFKIVGALVPLRVRAEDEIIGLDVSQHGEALQ